MLLRYLTSILQLLLYARARKTATYEPQASNMTVIFISYARHFLTFRLCQIYCITELQKVTLQKDKTILDSIPESGPIVRQRREPYLHLSSEVTNYLPQTPLTVEHLRLPQFCTQESLTIQENFYGS
ncbi:Uncharacterized protein APZ42_034603 [Daphnia magna]|uniref:Uncharacterized protein n=1 Tax=Daphnia magna TaxID=35525 RepID=A0A164K013_9CRUS|nr:Uncharacterized protein APZ42_034603 [Daphnia magna]